MVEVIVIISVPATEKLVPGTTGALLDRDHYEIDEPAHTRIKRIEFESIDDAERWVGTCVPVAVAVESLAGTVSHR